MGCNYWECKYYNSSQKGGLADCGKLDGSNIRQPCPKQPRDFCTEGELRDTDNKEDVDGN